MQNSYRKRIKFIQHTRLLFENEKELRRHLFRKSAEGRNGLARKNRSEQAVKKDYEVLEKYSIALTEGAFGIDGEASVYNLGLLLNDYERATSSGDFDTPLNNRLKSSRGCFYEYACYKESELKNFLFGFLNGNTHEGCEGNLWNEPQHKEKLYSALELKTGDRTSFVRNYYGVIGILLLLNALPLCKENARPNRSKRNLTNDTNVTFHFLKELFGMDGPIEGLLESEFKKWQQRAREETHWCRLQLIYSTMMLLNMFALQIDPGVIREINLPDNERTLKCIPCQSKYWKDQNNNEIFKLEKYPKGTDRSAYLSRFSNEDLKWERFELTFYRDRHVCIECIDSFFTYITEGKGDNASKALYRLSKDSITITGPTYISLDSINLVPIDEEMVSTRIKSCKLIMGFDKSRESMEPIAVMTCIMGNAIVLNNRRGEMYTVEKTEYNGLERILPNLRIGDKVGIIECDSREFLSFDADSIREVFEITTEEQKVKYGVKKMKASVSKVSN